MKQRAITAFFFVVAMFGGVFGGHQTFYALFLVIAAGSIWELMGLLQQEETKGVLFRKIAAVCVGVLPILAEWNYVMQPWVKDIPNGEVRRPTFGADPNSMFSVLMASTSMLFCLVLAELFLGSKKPFSQIGHYLLGLLYVTLPVWLLIMIAHLPETVGTNLGYHPNRVIGLLCLVWTNDTMAYLIGSKIGKTKLFERISPNKTWEGTIGGAICTVLVAWIFSIYFPHDFTTKEWLVLGTIVGLFGTLGDLVESMLKRSVGVKDSGNLLPGHGGLLDRFDAFIFVIPFVWVALMLLKG
jgi:phosphatidate cytidylyltransferase